AELGEVDAPHLGPEGAGDRMHRDAAGFRHRVSPPPPAPRAGSRRPASPPRSGAGSGPPGPPRGVARGAPRSPPGAPPGARLGGPPPGGGGGGARSRCTAGSSKEPKRYG